MARSSQQSSLLSLPAELIFHILSYLQPQDLGLVARTCRTLKVHSYDDQVWLQLLNDNIPETPVDPYPAKTFRELYLAHHPHWFLVKHRVWFADSEPSGKLVICRYEPRRACIEGYAVVAGPGNTTLQRWEKAPDVIIHSFNPWISLDLNQPVLQLEANCQTTQDELASYPSDRSYAPASMYNRETVMDIFHNEGLFGSFMLCKPLPAAAIGNQTSVWPPLRFSTPSRVRNSTGDGYASTGHRPSTASEVGEHNFRLRKWVEYTGRRASSGVMSFASTNGLSAALGFPGPYFAQAFVGGGREGMHIRLPEDITTYATLAESCYTPTKDKPWQGIWCGDYSGHGCEFLVITQPTKGEERPLPDGMGWLRRWFQGYRRRESSSSSRSSYASAQENIDYTEAARRQVLGGGDDDEDAEFASLGLPVHPLPRQPPAQSANDYEDAPTGQLEAIKLTGDPNIPRGEYTFIAPDIGHGGFMRICDEEIFRGARVVRSAGHIAGRGFREDQYTPSQLIMISHDTLAQFWEGFGHISFYRRVDLNALLKF